jgi:hypothetical protein
MRENLGEHSHSTRTSNLSPACNAKRWFHALRLSYRDYTYSDPNPFCVLHRKNTASIRVGNPAPIFA